nr:anti-repressor SinI family protein [Gracilibacillus phocaeensis]
MVEKRLENVLLDHEWIGLIKEAKKQGLSLKDVRQFLNHANKQSKVE